jgi:hypothetical protein
VRDGDGGHWSRAFAPDPSLLLAKIGEAIADRAEGRNGEGLKLLRGTEGKALERAVTGAEGIYKVGQAYAVLGDRTPRSKSRWSWQGSAASSSGSGFFHGSRYAAEIAHYRHWGAHRE